MSKISKRPILITCKSKNVPKNYVVTSKLKDGYVVAIQRPYSYILKNFDLQERESVSCQT